MRGGLVHDDGAMFAFTITSTITLRLLQPVHAAELYQVTDANRTHLRRWLPWLDHTRSEADTAAFIAGRLRGLADDGTFTCGIWHQGALCGVIGYNRIDWEARTAFPGYWLAEAAEGRGIMTRCCRVLAAHAFDEYRLRGVIITVAVGNHKSQAIPDRLGFTRIGIQRDAEWLYDRHVDHTINALRDRRDLVDTS